MTISQRSLRLIGAGAIVLGGGAVTIRMIANAQDSSRIALRGTDTIESGAIARSMTKKVTASQRSTGAAVTRPGLTNGVNRVPITPLKRIDAPALTPVPAAIKRKQTIEADPFAPVGLRLGSIDVFPSIDVEAGYDSNPNRVAGAVKGSALLRTTGTLRWQSDWTSGSFDGDLRGAYSYFNDIDGASRPDFDGRVGLKLDASRDLSFTSELRGRLETQSPQNANLPGGATGRPLVATLGATLGAEQRFGRASIALRGTADRTEYGDVELAGATASQSDRNVTQFGSALRLGYELSPGLKPFVEARADTRVYDNEADGSGFRRSSTGLGARVGTTLEVTRQLTGEVSIGPEARNYDDGRLRPLRGIVGDSSVIWSATPLTTVTLRAASSLDETTIIGSSGAVGRRASIEVSHALLRNLTVSGIGSIASSNFRGVGQTDTTTAGTAKIEYRLTRDLAFKTSITHERFESTLQGRDYTANVFLVGLKLTR